MMAKAYKLFRVNKKRQGELFPLFVDSNNSTPIGTWVEAKEGEQLSSGKVKSKLGPLCFRPGWHLSDIPLVVHIGVKDKDGKIAYQNSDYVWCECEYADVVDYQPKANENGMVKGKLVPKYAYLKEVPVNGCYRYKTSPNMLGNWIISGSIKILNVMPDNEVDKLVIAAGYEPMPRDGGPIKLQDYGF